MLTKEIADQFLAHEESVDLSEFTAIEDAAAQSLSKRECDLSLNGLTSLSDAAAKSLSKHQHVRIRLTKLPASAAKILKQPMVV